jgi:hypothetical protein
MFCPQCGQQQLSEAVRFCSRCGFQLGAVSGLLASGGVPQAGVVPEGPQVESPRRKGMRQGGVMLLFGIFLMPMFAILHELIGSPDKLPLIGVLFFMGGLLRLIYALVFEEGAYRRKGLSAPNAYAPGQFGGTYGAGELPPAQGQPAQTYVPPRVNTSEIGYRPSVTESTTRLLDEQREREARGEK